uniref:O-fucosyltransferase family protein n=1 Tax=Oryza glumipatula TaxID=40148 RepID=A0A0E0B638_9ORYZ
MASPPTSESAITSAGSASASGFDCLPDDLVHHVLSFLPAPDAARTSLLSRRWRNLWVSMPCLDIDSRGSTMLSNARSLFLNTLSVRDYFIHGCHDLILASPYLTKVVLEHVVLHDCHFGTLNSGCPALENLELLEVNIQFTEISSTSLKHLRIVNCMMDCKFWIRTPNLLTMCLDGVECKSSPILEYLPYLTTASVSVYGFPLEDSEDEDLSEEKDEDLSDEHHIEYNILGVLSHARSLNLIAPLREALLEGCLLTCPVFNNLKCLVLGDWCMAFDLYPLRCVLKQSPILEELCVELREKECEYCKENAPPFSYSYGEILPFKCHRLKTVKIKCGERDERFIALVKLFFKISVCIEKFDLDRWFIAFVTVSSSSSEERNERVAPIDLWGSKLTSNFFGCSNSSGKFLDSSVTTQPDRYLIIVTSGGLNQQRTGIVDAVVAARILNATLVVPELDQRSFWKDSSNFSEIFDINWFISFLAKDVNIIKEPPEKGGKAVKPYKMRVPRKCTPKCYLNRVLPALLKKHLFLWLKFRKILSHIAHTTFSLVIQVIRLTKYDYRLSNKLDKDLQKLRCRVNYHALRFTDPIQELGEKLIKRMREKSRHFIALHLRFEPDMLAFSGCYYGGGEKEKRELGSIRKRWKTLHIGDPEKGRRQGRCPLTPEEVGLMLRALGYKSDVHIYVASGEIYGGEDTLAPLKLLFPNYHTKETLSTEEELTPFLAHSSRMAAIDFIVCDGSDAFVTNNNGNMAKILVGRRRYFGHKRTIRPSAKQLYPLFMNRSNISWDAFSSQVQTIQKGFIGEPMEITPGRGEFHANPAACICEKTGIKSVVGSDSRSNRETVNSTEISNKPIGGPTYPIYTDEEGDRPDTEDDPSGIGEMIDMEAEDDSLASRVDSVLEEILSD